MNITSVTLLRLVIIKCLEINLISVPPFCFKNGLYTMRIAMVSFLGISSEHADTIFKIIDRHSMILHTVNPDNTVLFNINDFFKKSVITRVLYFNDFVGVPKNVEFTYFGNSLLNVLTVATGTVEPSDPEKLSCYHGSGQFTYHRLDFFNRSLAVLSTFSFHPSAQLFRLLHNGITIIPQGLPIEVGLTLTLQPLPQRPHPHQNKSMHCTLAQYSLYLKHNEPYQSSLD